MSLVGPTRRGARLPVRAAAGGTPHVTVSVPATSANLGPGFDALGLALEMRDRVTLLPAAGPPRVWASRPLPGGDDNLALRAARRVWEEAGAPGAFMLQMQLSIPVGRGLGSSAAAIVGGLVAANVWLRGALPPERLLQLAAEIEGHPDNVTPALLGGVCVACTQEGGGVMAVRLPLPAGLAAAVAVPERPLPTARARRALPARVPLPDATFNVQRAALLVAALATGRLDALREATRDRLHQPYRLPLAPGLGPALQAAQGAGALGAWLSGAGPSVLALCRAATARPVAAAMVAAFSSAGQRAVGHVLRPAETGTRVEEGPS